MPNPIPASTVSVSLLDSVEFSEPGPRVLAIQIDGPAAVPPHSECSDLRHPHGDVVLTLSDRLRPLGLTGVALLTLAVADRARGESTPCVGEVIASGIARAVIDGRTFVLDDGREVRLAAIEVPQLLTAAGPAKTAAAGGAARAALEHSASKSFCNGSARRRIAMVASAATCLPRAAVPRTQYSWP
jgi:hypothetical protein